MKKLILILALLFSLNGWAEDKFPIVITCSIDGGGIIQFHLTKELFEIKSKRFKSDPNSWLRIPNESAPFINIYIFNQVWRWASWRRNIDSTPTEMIIEAKPYIDKKLYIVGDWRYRLMISDKIIMVNFRSPLLTGIFGPSYVSTATIKRNTGEIMIYAPTTQGGSNELYGTCKKGLDIPVIEKDSLF